MKKFLLLLIALFLAFQLKAQNVGINNSGATPNLSALLDVDVSAFATKLGLLIPRVTLVQKTAMSPLPAVAQGLVVYQTDGIEGFYYNTSLTTTANWVYLNPNSSGWAVSGNTLTGTLPATPAEWIGSINAADWIVKTNNSESMRVTSGGNVGINNNAPSDKLSVNSSSSAANAISGTITSASTTNTYYGAGGFAVNGAYTPARGYLGYHNGSNVTFGVYGASGDLAGMFAGKVGINSVATALTTADLEIRNTTAGNPAVAMFRQTASQTTSGTILNRIDFGDNLQTTAEAQIAVIRGAAGGAGDLPTDIAFSNIPDGSTVLTERMRILNNGNVGIGTIAPASTLDVNGSTKTTNFQMTSGATLGYVLQGNATGNASWVSPSSFFAVGTGLSLTGITINSVWTASGTSIYNNNTGNVGIGTAAPDASAKLDITSSSSGLLIPRVALTASNVAGPVTSPLTSLLVYNTASAGVSPNAVTPGHYYWDGAEWVSLSGGPSSNNWSITGNAGTTVGTNFIGTTDARALAFKVNNNLSGYIDYSANANTGFGYQTLNVTNAGGGTFNTALGYQAMLVNTSGVSNTAIGYQALKANIVGNKNTAVGSNSLLTNTGIENTAVGFIALNNNTTGQGNTGVGLGALGSNQGGNYNVAVGYYALNGNTPNTTQINNVALGSYAGFNNQTGINNLFVGNKSGFSNTSGNYNLFFGNVSGYTTNSGSNNLFMGDSTGYFNTTGTDNIFLGNNAGYTNSTGIQNTFVGLKAGYKNTIGTENVFVGYRAGYQNSSGSFNYFGGYSAGYKNTVGTDNTFIGTFAGTQNTTGTNNTIIGSYSGAYNIITGGLNTFLGDHSGYSFSTGSTNTCIGAQAGWASIYSGNNNTFLGFNADASGNFSNSCAIGANAVVGASNAMVLGGTGTYAVNVGIGLTTPLYALHVTDVINVSGNQVGYFKNTYTGSADGVGVKGETSNTATNYGIGTEGIGKYIGVYGLGITGGLTGVMGTSGGATYGVYCSGNGAYTGTWSNVSDKRFKENIQPLTGALDKVLKLEPKTYTFKKDEQYKRMNFPESLQIGLIAQDVENVFPELVGQGISPKGDKEDQFTFKSMNYIGLTPILVQAIKEQQKIIEEQDNKINAQTKSIEELRAEVKAIQTALNKSNISTSDEK